MFLDTLRRRNPEFIKHAVVLHQKSEIPPNSYVIDYDAVKQNVTAMIDEAARLGLSLYPMTKQIGRNPAILDLLNDLGEGKIVVVDWMGARQVHDGGGTIGHVGHLVQVPRSRTRDIAELQPEVWTVFSQRKAREISRTLSGTDRIQDLLLRVSAEGDTFYRGHEGGIALEDLLDTARRIEEMTNVTVSGITSFPCLLFDNEKKSLYTTPNMETLNRSQELLEEGGFEIDQINAPGTTSTKALPILADHGATHVEPGHGMTGTTPPHALQDLPEKPAICYLSEVSHRVGDEAYFYGGGLYIDPVFPEYTPHALLSDGPESIVDSQYEADWIDPSGIDYYGMIQVGSGSFQVGDSVVLGFRPQAFVTRAHVTVVKGSGNGTPEVMGVWDSSGKRIA